MTTESIDDLISQVALRDRASYDRLYLATSPKLFGVCLRILKNRAEAEDALQDVFINIWQKAESFVPSRASAMSWLIVVARNQSIDRLRSMRGGHTELENMPELADGEPTPEQNAMASADRRQLNDCLQGLDDRKSDAVRAAYIEGYSYEELAARHDVPLNTMRTWLRRSLIALRECLER